MSDKVRLKDLDAKSREKYETLSPDLKAFVDEYKQLRGSVFKINSGGRSPEQKVGRYSEKSKHNTGDALDMSAMNYEDYYFLMNTKEGLSLLNKYQLGILDETDPVALQKTNGTGAHFHIGKDPKLYTKTKQRFEAFDNGIEPIISYKQRYELGEDPKTIVSEKHDHNHSHEDVKLSEDIEPFEVKQYQDVFTRVAEKEIVKDVKVEQSEDRKEIKNEISREEEFLREYLKPTAPKQPANVAQKEVKETVEPISINVDVQTQLPELQNIFQVPEMKEGGTVVSGNTTVVTDKDGNKTTKVKSKDGKTYVKVETKDGKVYNKVIEPMRSTMSYKDTENYKNGIQYPVIINQSDNTNATKPYIKNTQFKELIADIEGQKALANQLVTSGAASRYLGDKYWNQKGDESLRDMILKEIQRNPNLMNIIEKQEYQYLLSREQKNYDKASPFEKTASFIHSAVSDPVLVGSNLLEGKAPMLWQGVNMRDDRNPEVQRFYNQATGANNNVVNTLFNFVNPGDWGTQASIEADKGNYGTALGTLGLGIAGTLAGGVTSPGKGTAKVLNQLDDFATNTYDKVAIGESFIPYAWKSPIKGLDEVSSKKMFDDILQSEKLTPEDKALIAEYQFSSHPFTGRGGNIVDIERRKHLQEIIDKAGVSLPENTILSRYVNSKNPELFNIDKGVFDLGDRPVSFSAGLGKRYGYGKLDRIVISGKNAKLMESNLLKNPYSEFEEISLDFLQKKERENLNYLNSQLISKDLFNNLRNEIMVEKELIASGLKLKQLGRVKNDLGSYDIIMKPIVSKK